MHCLSEINKLLIWTDCGEYAEQSHGRIWASACQTKWTGWSSFFTGVFIFLHIIQGTSSNFFFVYMLLKYDRTDCFSSWKMLKESHCLFLLKVESYILLVIWQSKTSHKETVVSTTDGSPLELTCEEAQVAIVEDEEKSPYEGTCGKVDIDDDGASTTQVVRQLMLVEHQHKEVQV